MLSETSYLTALSVYCGAAVMIVLCLLWWLNRRWSAGWVALVVLLHAALLLTPAYPREGVETLAPALIVVVFQLLTEGFEAAEHAIRPLLYTCGFAVVLAALLRITVLRPRKNARDKARADEPGAEPA